MAAGSTTSARSATTTLTNSIVAGNAAAGAGDDLFGVELAFRPGVHRRQHHRLGAGELRDRTARRPPDRRHDQAALERCSPTVANDPNTGVLSGVLADNGGPVQTVALAPTPTNPAIDAGDRRLADADGTDLDGDGDTADVCRPTRAA